MYRRHARSLGGGAGIGAAVQVRFQTHKGYRAVYAGGGDRHAIRLSSGRCAPGSSTVQRARPRRLEA